MNKKSLKITSAALLALALHQGFELIRGLRVFKSVAEMELTGAEQAIMPFVNILFAVFSGFLMLVVVLLGIKGLAESRGASSDKYHIIIARILNVYFALGLISGVGNLFSGVDLGNTIISVIVSALYTVTLFLYARAAKEIRLYE